MAVAVVAAFGVLTAAFIASGGKGTADPATEMNQFLPVQNVPPTEGVELAERYDTVSVSPDDFTDQRVLIRLAPEPGSRRSG
jgi:hypothetical protein